MWSEEQGKKNKKWQSFKKIVISVDWENWFQSLIKNWSAVRTSTTKLWYDRTHTPLTKHVFKRMTSLSPKQDTIIVPFNLGPVQNKPVKHVICPIHGKCRGCWSFHSDLFVVWQLQELGNNFKFKQPASIFHFCLNRCYENLCWLPPLYNHQELVADSSSAFENVYQKLVPATSSYIKLTC